MKRASNPKEPLITHIYTADPSAHVFNERLYIYPSHDLDHDGTSTFEGDHYAMEDYHILSMEDLDAACVDHGEALHLNQVPWAGRQMWAPDAAFKNGIYYLFFPARDKQDIFRIGVATSLNPEGPFLAQEHYLEGSYSIDPAVLVDDDGRAYMYFGGLRGGQLEKWTDGSFQPHHEGPDKNEKAIGPRIAELADDLLSLNGSPTEIQIVDEDGNPILAGDEQRRFFEGAWVHKYQGNYYLSYSTGTTHYIAYAVSKTPQGPFVYKGVILQPVVGWTTHHSIVEFREKWYLFYHDSTLSGGISHKRCVKFAELTYNEDGTIQTIDPNKL